MSVDANMQHASASANRVAPMSLDENSGGGGGDELGEKSGDVGRVYEVEDERTRVSAGVPLHIVWGALACNLYRGIQ